MYHFVASRVGHSSCPRFMDFGQLDCPVGAWVLFTCNFSCKALRSLLSAFTYTLGAPRVCPLPRRLPLPCILPSFFLSFFLSFFPTTPALFQKQCPPTPNPTYPLLMTTIPKTPKAVGVDFFNDRVGLVVGSNERGAAIWRSEDQGKTVKEVASSGVALGWLAVGAALGFNSAVAGGVVASQFTLNTGESFQACIGSAGPAYSVESIGEGIFAITGDTFLFNGVASSRDGGRFFTTHSVPNWKEEGISARFGAFPDEKIFMVAGGSFPGKILRHNDSGVRSEIHITERVSVVRSSAGGHRTRILRSDELLPRGSGRADRYVAAIAVSNDRGVTWTELFRLNDMYAFNQIGCFDSQRCVVTADAKSGPGAGAWILYTDDGGVTWNTAM